ncbi:hypothetical protein HPB47_025071 [Ixodes persulcatus]|uniref:Uncharacterized protein n=1 Tax=Ixodes persulcatus TaxID=34615 RepID=A0AC60Q2H1_IXOPE|nr:hypothetical protein HPB47_025071 [Ixodes persulcatus]
MDAQLNEFRNNGTKEKLWEEVTEAVKVMDKTGSLYRNSSAVKRNTMARSAVVPSTSAPYDADEHGGASRVYIVGGRNLGSSETCPSTQVHRRRRWENLGHTQPAPPPNTSFRQGAHCQLQTGELSPTAHPTRLNPATSLDPESQPEQQDINTAHQEHVIITLQLRNCPNPITIVNAYRRPGRKVSNPTPRLTKLVENNTDHDILLVGDFNSLNVS